MPQESSDAPDGETLDRAGEIFHTVRSMGLAAREEAIANACNGDATLAALVHLLLKGDQVPMPMEAIADNIRAAHEAFDDIHGTHPSSLRSAGRTLHTEGTHIGNYRLLERLGEGGFGVVFMAAQEHPIQRRVALKIIKLGMDTRQVVARFEAERQALALMDHTNIAKVFDAGATLTGRPFFVMELVNGIPITDFCDKHKLSIFQRLDLVSTVCDAIQHAHSKGVIHRDIKPSNVLVSLQNGKATAKIIDFGIAKAIDHSLTEKTLFTEHKQLIGTPEYMSPEQAEGSRDIDTRTDVYSIGVLLYEILVGATPFDSRRLRSAAFAEMQRIIREEEPPQPSRRISTQPALSDAIAQSRATLPTRLFATVRGDLDWIVMKAIEKDPRRRYPSVNALGDDIHRFLSGHVVSAAPPNRWYLLSKFCRRHRVAVVTTSLVFSTLLIGLIGITLGYRQSAMANTNLAKALIEVKRQQTQADISARRERAVHGFFFNQLLNANDPDISAGEEMRVRTVLNNAVRDLETVTDPDLEASLRQEIGAVYISLGKWNDAIPQLEQALQLRESAIPPSPDSDVSDILLLLSRATQIAGDPVRSESLARRARALRLAQHGTGSDQVAEADYYLAGALNRLGRTKDAGAVCEESLAAQSSIHAPGSETTMMARIMVIHAAEYLSLEGRHADAAAQLRKAIEILRRSRNTDSLLAWALSKLGTTAAELKDFEESDRSVQEAINIRRRLYPEGHTTIAQSLLSLGISRMRRGDASMGEEPAREAIAIYAASLGENHEFVARSYVALGAILASQAKWTSAADTYAKAARLYRNIFPGDHAQTAMVISQQGGCLIESNDFQNAESLLLESWNMLERVSASLPGKVLTAERLVHLYSLWGNDKSKADWTRQLETLKSSAK